MKFDYSLGNPPYDDRSQDNDQKGYAPPVYHYFLDESIKIADKVILIHPARFLFNAGSTPKSWNRKKLADPHFKILFYESNPRGVFQEAEIKGGVAISYQDSTQEFEPIEVFTPYPLLNSIFSKFKNISLKDSLKSITLSRTSYRFTDVMHAENPEAKGQMTKGHAYDMATNIFHKLPQVFYQDKPNDGKEYVQIIGLKDKKRVTQYIRRDYINTVTNLDAYKVVMPSANGNGNFGEVITNPFVGKPGEASTETFITFGKFKTEEEANNALKYIKTKFARTLYSVLKVTPNNTPEKWKYVPLQDFTKNSDIDWSKSIPEIDQQLYRKYELSDDEITFIEEKVQAME